MTEIPVSSAIAAAAVTDEEIMAYADGALAPDRRAAVRLALALDPALMEKLESFLLTRAPLAPPFDGVLTAPIPDKFLAVVYRPATTSKPRRGLLGLLRAAMSGPAASFRMSLLAVAAICLIFFGGWFARTLLYNAMLPDGHLFVILDEHGLIAMPSLQRALEATPREGSADISPRLSVKPRTTFRSRSGSWCREFELIYDIGLKGRGLACRRSDGIWRVLVATVPPGEEYEIAGPKNRAEAPPSRPPTSAVDEGKEILDAALGSISPQDIATPDKVKSLIAGHWQD